MSQRICRRHFLQLAAGTLAALGLDQAAFCRQAQQYSRALAQPTARKLALLVGINAYPRPVPPLRGCLTDVEMQYELLVHRYGFNPRDILVVADRALSLPGQTIVAPPTRQNILEAFEAHLIGQAKPEDVVVFHYSGHGALVREEDGIPEFNGYNGTIVPLDGRSQAGDRVDDIMGKTLFLLSKALPTDRLTLVLDSCHSGGGIRGNVVVRALNNLNARPSDRELAYQEQWMSRLELDEATLRDLRRQGIAKGVALGSAQQSQFAAEVPFAEFYAGAFTYLLTRYLWQLPSPQPLAEMFVNMARSTKDVANKSGIVQDPIFATAPGQSWGQQPAYLVDLERSPAEAVIREVQGDQVSFWLGGLSVSNLLAQEAVFSLVDDQGNPLGQVLQTERQGLMGRGVLQGGPPSGVQPGQLMREQIRGVPANLTLTIGVDPSVGDEAAALASLNQISRLEAVPLTQETPVDYVLGRLTPGLQGLLPDPVPAAGNRVGLFTPDLAPVPGTFKVSSGAISDVIALLKPRLKMLLAGKMLSSLINSSVSSLAVEMAVLQASTQRPLVSIGSRSAHSAGQSGQVLSGVAQVQADTEIQVQVQNRESQDLFISILTIASNGTLAILHPVVWNAPEEAARLPAGATVVVPDQAGEDDRFRFIARGPAGFFELMVLASTSPLRDALRSLQSIARGRRSRSGNPLAFTDGVRGSNENEDAPVEMVDALMGDLDRSAAERGRSGRTPRFLGRSQQVDAGTVAAFSVAIEVVE